MGSKPFNLDRKDWIKIGKGAGLAAAGAAVVYLTRVFGDIEATNPVGEILAFAAMVLLNSARKWINDNSKPQ